MHKESLLYWIVFWQNYIIWQSVSLFFMLMVSGLLYKASILINLFCTSLKIK